MPADNKRPLKVFLCHAHADRDAVRGLYTRLTQDGVDAWLDKEKLLPGQDWELEIRKAVREADVVVVCLSKQFNQAGFRQKEVRLALDTAMEMPEGEIFIIPARLEECDTLESLRKWHWVDLFEEDGYEMLMRALRARANRIGATLQVKKGWLPKISAPRSKPKKSVEDKKLEESKEEVIEVDDDVLDNLPSPPDDLAPPPDSFPDGWGDEWQPGFETETTKTSGNDGSDEPKNQRELERAIKKIDRDHNARLRKIEWQYRWETFLGEIGYRLKLLRINFVPVLIVLIGLVVIIPLSLDIYKNIPELAQPLNVTLTSISPSLTSPPITPPETLEATQADETPTVTMTPTESIAPTTTPYPTQITDSKGVTMRLVPAGGFMMGSANGSDDEKPVHQVYLNAFYMDIYEVTNAAYKVCVEAGVCDLPKDLGSFTRSIYYGISEFDNYPVIYVDWDQANVYCAWRDASLPTEAQWEKAARGTDGRTYSWGNQFDGSYTNFCDKNCAVTIGLVDNNSNDGYAETAPVGSYENGKSPYGMYDMAGNVWEWVADWYDSDYYETSPTSNPMGPILGYDRVLRGGSWSYNTNSIRSTYRFNLSDPTYALSSVGIRCAKDASP